MMDIIEVIRVRITDFTFQRVLEHLCEDGKKLEGWKIKHQVIKL